MSRSLKDYWYEVYQYGYHTRTYEPNRGMERWQFYKNMYSSIPDTVPLSQGYKKLFESVKYKSAGKEDADATVTVARHEYNNNIEKFHFLVQLFRIPKLSGFNVPFIKALQIAYNAGQLQAMLDQGEYDPELMDFINENRLIEIATYFEDPDQKINTKVGSNESISINYIYVILFVLFVLLFYYLVKTLSESFTGFGASHI